MTETPLEEACFEASWRSERPLAGSAKQGPYRRTSRALALTQPYIETNPLCLRSLMVTDVDTGDVHELAAAVGLPAASWAVRSHNAIGSGHIGYALTTPVCVTDAAKRKPVNLLARIETGLCTALGGDVGYTGRITKNPITPGGGQCTLWGEDFPSYSLGELAAALDRVGVLPHWRDPAPRRNSGVGRNVDLFDRTRKWSYQAIRRYWADGIDTWGEVVDAKAHMLNLTFEQEGRETLPALEVKHLSKSISRWTWGRFNEQEFTHIQAARGRKGAAERWGGKDRRELVQSTIDGEKS